MKDEKIDLILNYDREMRNINRYQTVFTLQKQNIAEHGCFVDIE